MNGDGAAVARLELGARLYRLALPGEGPLVLDGGCAALLAGAGPRLREADVEAAIERAEDWLMPFSRRLIGLALRVRDGGVGLNARLGAGADLAPQAIEAAFSAAFDDVALGRAIDAPTLAAIVLLRELVHHGALTRVVLEAPAAGA